MPRCVDTVREARMLFVGEDWARDHHDVELVDEYGKKLRCQ